MSGRSPPLYCTLTLIAMQGCNVNLKAASIFSYPVVSKSSFTSFLFLTLTEFRSITKNTSISFFTFLLASFCKFVILHPSRFFSISFLFTVDVPIYRPVVARPKRTGKQGKPVNRYTGENARTCTKRADVSPQTSIWRVCVSPAVVVACNYSIISARVCNTAVHRRQQFSYDSSALSAQAGVHSIGTVPKT